MASVTALAGASSASAELTALPLVDYDFKRPVQVIQPPNDPFRLFVVGQRGGVRVIKQGQVLQKRFLDIRDNVKQPKSHSDERGLLSLAFPPNYGNGTLGTTRNFYAFFVNHGNDIRVAEYKRNATNGDLASAASKRIVLRITHPSDRRHNHYGGQLAFGPDGYLYVSVGDGGGGDPGNRALRKDRLQGKLLRIGPQPGATRPFTVPPDNPYYGSDVPGDGRVWARGLRNPWRFSFDGTKLLLPDVGEARIEELNSFATVADAKAANLGWSGYEGPLVYKSNRVLQSHRPPDFVYCHEDYMNAACAPEFEGCTIIGGQVAHDPQLPSLDGRYVYGDFCAGELRSLDPANPSGTDAPLDLPPLSPFGLTSFGTDNAGRIYMTHFIGTVYRLVDVPSP
jgi:glucose/arabinose dehydrogenase